VSGLLAFGAASAASAAPAAHPDSGTPAGTFYSTHLAGHIASGSRAIGAVRGNVLHLPNLSAYTGAADTIAEGYTIAQSGNAGAAEYGIGVVWNDPAGCGAGQWTLEGNTAGAFTVPAGGPVPVPLAALVPLQNFGANVCLSPGAGEALQVFFSPKLHEILFADGSPADNSKSTIPDETIAAVIHGVTHNFYAAGIGVTTFNGADAALVPTGTLSSFQGAYLEATGSLKPVPFDFENLYAVVGTVSGGAPSVGNPQTLSNGVNTSIQAWTVVAP
jgi:hypothetical protein